MSSTFYLRVYRDTKAATMPEVRLQHPTAAQCSARENRVGCTAHLCTMTQVPRKVFPSKQTSTSLNRDATIHTQSDAVRQLLYAYWPYRQSHIFLLLPERKVPTSIGRTSTLQRRHREPYAGWISKRDRVEPQYHQFNASLRI